MTDLAADAAPRGSAFTIPVWIAKTVLLWIAANAGSVLAGAVPVALPPPLADGPLTSAQALLVVNGLIAVALALVAATARVRRAKLALLLFFAYFVIASVMMQIETLWFNESLKLPLVVIGQLVVISAIQAVVVAGAGALLFHPQPAAAEALPAGMTRRIAVMALIYVVLYYGAGMLIAWQSAAVRAYYENGIHIAFVPTLLFQIFRGLLWAIIALIIAARLKGPLAQRALVMGVLFSVMTAAQLLYPTSFFPWPVRAAHLAEVGASEFAYGVIVTVMILSGAAQRPLTGGLWQHIAGRA